MDVSRPKSAHKMAGSFCALLLTVMPALVFAQAASPFMTGATALQSNILILRCAGSEHGGTSQFASRLIGEREVLRTSVSRSHRPFELLPVINRSENSGVEAAVMASEIEQLPDLAGYLKLASRPEWMQVALSHPAPARAVVQRRARGSQVPQQERSAAGVADRAHEGFGME